jgi:23S rRNA (guanosine2251-2'-O)-methyltransferase
MRNNERNNQKRKEYKKDFKDFRKDRRDFSENKEEAGEAIYGRNAILELLKTDREIDKIFILSGEREGSVKLIESKARERGIPVIDAPKEKLDRLSNGGVHQGVAAFASAVEYVDVDDIFARAEERGHSPFIVIADGIEDPHNLGALIRCAEGAGAHGIIIPKRRSTGVTPLVAKSSAGAIEHMAIAKVSNIAATIRELKEQGVWTFAAEAGGKPYYETDFKGACALVFGSEGDGVSKIVIDTCDALTSIPMYGKVNSLNVSTAASVILCHAARIQHS